MEFAIIAFAKLYDIIKNTPFSHSFIITSLAFFLIIAISFLIFDIGEEKEKKKNKRTGSNLLISFGFKFIAELVLVFFYFFIAKKSEIKSLFSFFILYLAFTMLWINAMIIALKNKNL